MIYSPLPPHTHNLIPRRYPKAQIQQDGSRVNVNPDSSICSKHSPISCTNIASPSCSLPNCATTSPPFAVPSCANWNSKPNAYWDYCISALVGDSALGSWGGARSNAAPVHRLLCGCHLKYGLREMWRFLETRVVDERTKIRGEKRWNNINWCWFKKRLDSFYE